MHRRFSFPGVASFAAGLLFQLNAAPALESAAPIERKTAEHTAVQKAGDTAELLRLGTEAYEHGYFSQSLALWPRAWETGRDSTDENTRARADRAFAEWMRMLCRLGWTAELRAGLASVAGREFRGSTAEMVQVARDALWVMENKPGVSFRCGPHALQRILMHSGAANMWPMEIVTSESPPEGIALREVAALSAKVGMNYQMARRVDAAAEIPVPAVLHWKLDHYGAVVKKEGSRYLLDDPTFGNGLMWISEDALRSEGSGCFLLPPGPLPAGWEAINDKEGADITGKGYTNGDQPGSTGPGNPGRGGPPPPPPPPGEPGDDDDDDCGGGGPPDNRTPNDGMAGWDVSLMMVSLEVSDIPVGYRPPVGPAIYFPVQYNQRETNQPAVLDYANFGKLWNCDWIGSLTFDSTTAYYNRGQGGIETFTGFDSVTQSYAPGYLLANRLVKISSTNYELRRPDGGKIVFSLPNNASNPTRIFMTQVVDPQGNAATLTYDAGFRLTGVKDAINQTSTLTYGTGGESLLVKKITDPFGRFATFDYDGSGRLIKITDVIGLTSEFTYGAGDVMQTLKTGYGTTSFNIGSVNSQRYVEITHPNGDKERFEQRNGGTPGIPASEPAALQPKGFPYFNAYLDGRNTFHWDRKAMRLAAGDFTRARQYHFLHQDLNTRSPILESYKMPGANRVWLTYQGQNNGGFYNQGLMGHAPARTARVLPDGSTQAWNASFNHAGQALTQTDPAGRELQFTYAPNGLDLIEVRRKTGVNSTVILGKATWDSRHLLLSETDASGGTSTYSWNARGQLLTMTNAKNETATQTYNANGYLTAFDGPLAGAGDTWSWTYDAFGRVATETSPGGYTLAYTWDALNRTQRVTYPDGSYEETTWALLDPVSWRDRRGRLTMATYDALGFRTSITDPLGRTERAEWCRCGRLKAVLDAMNRRTEWLYDVAGRATGKVYPDASRENYAYDSAGRLASVTDAAGQRKVFRYGLDDLVTGWHYENSVVPTPAVSLTWDATFDRLVSRSDGTGTTLYDYYPINATPSAGAGFLRSIDGPLANDTIVWTYDVLGRMLTRSIGGAVQSQTYDAADRVATGTNALGTFSFTYDGATERVATATFPGGRSTTYSYFPAAGDFRLREIRHLKPGGAVLAQYTYTRDAEGIIQTWSQQRDAGPASVWTCSYDTADRLTGVTATNPARTLAWSYDTAGNRLTETINGAGTSASYNAANELTATNPAPGPDRTFEWDAEGRLAAVNYNGSALRTEFTYDAQDRRVRIVEKNGASVTSDRRYLWVGNEICEERNADGSVAVQFFTHGMKVLSGAQAGTWLYALDHLSSVREITDGAGTPAMRRDFDPWGRTTTVSGTLESRFSFASYFDHAPSGLRLTHYRAYTPVSGRWISADPLADAETLPEGPNLFAYAGNDPVNFLDPDGLQMCKAGGNNKGKGKGDKGDSKGKGRWSKEGLGQGRGAFGNNSKSGQGTQGTQTNGDFRPRTESGGRSPSGGSGGALPGTTNGGYANNSSGGFGKTGGSGNSGSTGSGGTGSGGHSNFGGWRGNGGSGSTGGGYTGGNSTGGGYSGGGYSGGGYSGGGYSGGGYSGGHSKFGGWK